MNPNRHARLFALGTTLAGALILGGSDRAADAAGATPAPAPAAAPEAGGFVGSDSCINCHEHEGKAASLLLTIHGKTGISDRDGGVGCEACHGPGEAHVKGKGKTVGMLDPATMSTVEVTALCGKCHEGGEHAFWQGGAHETRDMSCLTCHQLHQERGPLHEALLKKSNVFETCTSCHLQKRAAILRSSHMPIREGSMTCTSCHNPHGSAGPSQLAQFSVNENCYSCHAEKRSPMLWEHAPVKESCVSCHDPHGSLHPNMLKARVPRLCQQCHDEARHPTQPYGSAQAGEFFPGTRLFNHGCANCHPNVHGSNHPAGVRFMR